MKIPSNNFHKFKFLINCIPVQGHIKGGAAGLQLPQTPPNRNFKTQIC
jgi:hypothetical protein